MIATETTMLTSSKLKIKFACKRVDADPGNRIESSDDRKVMRDYGQTVDVKGLSSGAKSSFSGAKKRGPSGDIDAPKEKKLKMDRKVKGQCSMILNALFSHKDSWAFKEPVDPIKLNIPDYFNVISSPMDLGTVRSKLNRDMYSGAGEFAADVRLIFSNCILYNPPDNPFHKFAKELKSEFEMKWRPLDEKWTHDRSQDDRRYFPSGHVKNITDTTDTRQSPQKFTPLHTVSVTKSSVPCKEKVGIAFGANNGEAELAKTAKKSNPPLLGKNPSGGYDNGARQSSDSRAAKQLPSLVGSTCVACGNITCQCNLHGKSSDMSFGRDRNHHLPVANVTRQDCQAKWSSASQLSKSDPESDGAVSALDAESICPSPQLITPVKDSASGEEWNTPMFSVPLSPKKALRAAMLKSRFADTILKAQQKSLNDQGNRSDPMKMQQEKARLERRQREEKARIEAEIRAAKAAAERQAELELKEKHEREREEARIALEKVERTVEFEQNRYILEELERLAGYNGRPWGSHFRLPLERLGLYIKEEDTGEVDEMEDGEEGEIL